MVFFALGLFLSIGTVRGRWHVPACLALSVAMLPAYLLPAVLAMAFYRRDVLPGRRHKLLFGGLTALCLADVWFAPAAKVHAWLAASNLPGGWPQAAAVGWQTGPLAAFGPLPIVLDVLIGLAGLIGLGLMPRRWSALALCVALAVLVVPAGYRPWFLICGPFLAFSAGRALEDAASLSAKKSPVSLPWGSARSVH
jgi:hypothetical protein